MNFDDELDSFLEQKAEGIMREAMKIMIEYDKYKKYYAGVDQWK